MTEGCDTKPLMTLDEAISHAESRVNDTPCGQAHKQLSDWLKELREYRSGNFGRCEPMRNVLLDIHGELEKYVAHRIEETSLCLHIKNIINNALKPKVWEKEVCDKQDAPVGNSKAIHEALVKIHDLVNSLDENCGVDPIEVRDIAREALDKPIRYCDMFDTPMSHDEEEVIWATYHRWERNPKNRDCDNFPIHGIVGWLLSPTKTGEAK